MERKNKPLFMYQVDIERTTDKMLREGEFIAMNGSHVQFKVDDQQFLCLKQGRYFTDTLTLINDYVWVDCPFVRKMLSLFELDACWQIIEREN